MQLKYNRQQNVGGILARFFFKLILLAIILVVGIFLIEKINFPSPDKNYQIDVTNEIKQLK